MIQRTNRNYIQKYRTVEPEQLKADVCYLVATIDAKDRTITMDFDGFSNDSQSSYYPSLTINTWFGLESGTIQNKITYICSFYLCNEKFFSTKRFMDLLDVKMDTKDNLILMNFYREKLYNDADIGGYCFDGRSNVVKCVNAICYASGR